MSKSSKTNNRSFTQHETPLKESMWLIAGDTEKLTTEEVFAYVKAETLRARNEVYTTEVGIGTDSQMIGRNFRFVSVICLYRKGKGGFYFYRPESIPREKYQAKNQKLRMFDEVAKSIELSVALQEQTGIVASIHIDASPLGKGEFTSAFSDQLKGYVQSCGYACLLKPDSYVSSGLADQHSKSKSARKERRKMRQAAALVAN
jgi:uncharacterized protein